MTKQEQTDNSSLKTKIKDDIYLINLEQRTKEWLKFREDHITATDIKFIMETFVYERKLYGMDSSDFFNYKYGIDQKPKTPIAHEFMAKGNMMEEIAEKAIEDICNDLHEASDFKNDFTYSKGIILERHGWLMASYDYMIYKDGEILFPIEVKHVNSEKTYQKCCDIDHIYYYQLASQMITCKSEKGMLLFFTNSDYDTVKFRIIDRKHHYHVDILKNMPIIKNIYKDVCVNKINPCEKNISEAKKIANKLLEIDKSINEVSSNQDNISEYTDKVNDYKARNIELTKEIDLLSNKIKVLQNELESNKTKINNYILEIQNKEAQSSSKKSLKDKKESLREELVELMINKNIHKFYDDKNICKFDKRFANGKYSLYMTYQVSN